MSDLGRQSTLPDAWRLRVREARAILFDFDGTLAPNLDLPDLRRQVVEFTLAHQVPEPVFAGRYIVEILDAAADWLAAQDTGTAEAFHRRGHALIREFEVAAARDTVPFEDAVTALQALRRAGKRLAVITRNCRDAVLTVYPDLPAHCDGLLARDDVPHLKPDPRHLNVALDAVGEPAERAIMVGDGEMDMHLGRSRGMFCIGVLTGSSDETRLLEAGADVVVPRAGSLSLALEQGPA